VHLLLVVELAPTIQGLREPREQETRAMTIRSEFE
jgi:hypothetical protein